MKKDSRVKLLENLTEAEIKALLKAKKEYQFDKKEFKLDLSDRHFKVGIVSDNHFGCKFTDKQLLHKLYEMFRKEKVDFVCNPGDIVDGINMHKGHVFELYAQGLEEQVKDVIRDYPIIDVPTYFIDGNHDESHYKQSGMLPGTLISKERKDMIYLGARESDLITKLGTKIRLSHPAKGTSYAISYQPQKYIESISGGKKPEILLIGHFHKMEYLFYRNIHSFQTGTTCQQTPWMRSMNLAAHMGGWIIDVYVKKDGKVERLKQEMIPCYE